MNQPKTIICTNLLPELSSLIADKKAEEIFILCDDNSLHFCLPKLMGIEKLRTSKVISINAGDENKNVEALVSIWKELTENGADRKSLMINLGGGMITDIGGFAASTFKRGIDYINVSTTLLGAVDAATGGKTGINFLGYKNEIGAFNPAKAVLIDVDFFRTLDDKNLRSGFAEMIKHALIHSKKDWLEIQQFDLENLDFDKLRDLLRKNIEIKEDIVAKDPKEIGLRKALNFGHTFGHAIESFSYKQNQPLLHGYAIAFGMICETYLSHLKLGFPKEELLKLKYLVKEIYGSYDCGCMDYEELIKLMKHDKKNERNKINFTLLSDIGEVKINQTATKEEIIESFDILTL